MHSTQRIRKLRHIHRHRLSSDIEEHQSPTIDISSNHQAIKTKTASYTYRIETWEANYTWNDKVVVGSKTPTAFTREEGDDARDWASHTKQRTSPMLEEKIKQDFDIKEMITGGKSHRSPSGKLFWNFFLVRSWSFKCCDR